MRAPKRSEYPKNIKVGFAQVPYKIRFVSDKKWLGKCSYNRRTIWLNSKQPDRNLFTTFLHELLHAIEFETGTRIKHKIIYRFEEGLYSFLTNNLATLRFKK